jgi:hypothetical protein
MIIEIAAAILFLSCISATVLIVLGKLGFFTFIELRVLKRKILGVRLPSIICYFCFGFWIGFAISVFLIMYLHLNLIFFSVPFASASLTRKLIANIE